MLALIKRIELNLKEFKILRLIQNLLREYDNIISKRSENIDRISIIKYKINLVYFFSIMVKQKTFNFIMQKKIKKKIRKLLK